jgi:hypothetical protein
MTIALIFDTETTSLNDDREIIFRRNRQEKTYEPSGLPDNQTLSMPELRC